MDTLLVLIDEGIKRALDVNPVHFTFAPVNVLEDDYEPGMGKCPKSRFVEEAAELLGLDEKSLSKYLCGWMVPSTTAPKDCKEKAMISCACRVMPRELLERIRVARAPEPDLDNLENLANLPHEKANVEDARLAEYELGQGYLLIWEPLLGLTGEDAIQAVEVLVACLAESGGDVNMHVYKELPCPLVPRRPPYETVLLA